MLIQKYYPKIFIKSKGQIMCGLNFYGSNVTIIKWPGKYSQGLHLKHKFMIAAEAHLSTTLHWPKHFRFYWFMPSLGVYSPWLKETKHCKLQKHFHCATGSFTSNFCAVTIRTATFEKPNESLGEKSKQQFEAKHCRQRQQHQRVFWQSIHDKCQAN